MNKLNGHGIRALGNLQVKIESFHGAFEWQDYLVLLEKSPGLVQAINSWGEAGKMVDISADPHSNSAAYDFKERSFKINQGSLATPTQLMYVLAHEIYGHDGTRDFIANLLNPQNPEYRGLDSEALREAVTRNCFTAETLGFVAEHRVAKESGILRPQYPLGVDAKINAAYEDILQFVSKDADGRMIDMAVARYVTTWVQKNDMTHAAQCVNWSNSVVGSPRQVGITPANMTSNFDPAASSVKFFANPAGIDFKIDGVRNSDGTSSVVVSQPDGDSVRNEFTSEGVVTSSTEIDGARNDSDYASRTMGYDPEGRQDWRSTKYDDGTSGLKDFDQNNQRADRSTEVLTDVQGREDWKQVIYDDSSVHWKDFDQRNEYGHRSWENLVDAQDREDWQRVTHDDSSVHWKDFDQKNEFGHRIWENLVDAQGREDWQRVTHDDSSVHWKDFDQKNEFGHRIWENLVDAQGREDWQRVTHDDSSVHWKDLDQRNEFGHRSWENLVDAQGREDWQRVTHDDGSVHGKDFDQKNEHGYRIWENLVDAQGREDWQQVTHDDGSVHGKDFDQKNEHGYRVWEHLVDAQGREDWQLLTQDNGRSDRFDFDQDSSKSWSKVEQHFDAQGREDNASVYNDDGSRLDINYDQDGTQSWSQQTATFNAFGVQVARSMTFDNGIVSNEQGSGSHFSYSSGGIIHVYDPYVHHDGGRDMPPNSACVGTSDGWSCEPRYGESYGH